MRLSLCIASYNEESNIHFPLDSAIDLADEVIIVDGGSTDNTVEKAKSYGKKVRVFIEANPPMFHINKQKAIEKAKGEWILQLDADEALSDGLIKEIKEKITDSKFNSEFVAYWVPRKNFFLTRFLLKGGQYPDYTIRLYRNGAVRFPLKTVHENVELNLEFKVQNSEFKNRKENLNSKINSELSVHKSKLIGYLKNPILHYADPTFSRYLRRWDRYTTLEADQLLDNGLRITDFKKSTMFLVYFIIKPAQWFFLTYFRHLGMLDGFPGFIFALFSSLRFWLIYIKLWHKQNSAPLIYH